MSSQIVDFTTPDKVLLTGIHIGNPKSRTCYIFIHGLGGSVFSNRELAKLLVDKDSSVLLFNNRGHDLIARIKKIDKRKKKGTVSFTGGAAHEVFTDCVDDIEGAVQFATSQGAKQIILVGHSTGSQKSIYYLISSTSHSRGGKQSRSSDGIIKGVVLLSPLSDFAGIIKHTPVEDYKNLLKISEALVMQGTPHQLLPTTIWPALADAQRFLSLATPMSEEAIFSYYDPNKESIFSSINTPTLILLGDADEYRDRPIKKIKDWFDTHQNTVQYQSKIIKDGDHGFSGKEKEVAQIIRKFAVDSE